MRGALLALVVALAPALAVRVAWLSPAPGVYQEGRTLRLEVRVSPDPGERILEVRAVALPSGKWVMDSRPGSGGGVVLRYWDTTGFAGTTALRLEVAYMGGRGDTAYAILPVQIVGAPRGQNLQSQGLVEDLDQLITDACRFIGFYDLGSVRWLCTAHRTVKKAIRYFDQLQSMWEDFKSQAMYYGTGLALDWLGKSLGLHQLNPLVDEVDRALDGFMSDIRRQKNAILRALARARQKQLAEIYGWTPDGDPLYWGPEWWAKLISGVVPQLGFQATEQSLKDLQRTAQLLENQSRVAENVQNQQENTKPENVFQDLWDTLGAVWNFISEAIQKGWTALTGISGASADAGAPLPTAGPAAPQSASIPQAAPSAQSNPSAQGAVRAASGNDPTIPGISETLIAEAESAPSTREVTEVLVKGFAEMLRLEGMNGMRAIQEMRNLATQQAMTVEQLSQVNQNLVELIKKQESAAEDQLRQAMAMVASQAEKTSAKYVVAGEALAMLARQWRAESGTPPNTGGGP
jgi:hypothetical protein